MRKRLVFWALLETENQKLVNWAMNQQITTDWHTVDSCLSRSRSISRASWLEYSCCSLSKSWKTKYFEWRDVIMLKISSLPLQSFCNIFELGWTESVLMSCFYVKIFTELSNDPCNAVQINYMAEITTKIFFFCTFQSTF